ncbi:MAG: hypothetical protein Pg6C_10880 [Treponemataceae bacterium]|nr:MAG: hypothetical protein Pg6C_10880 [Treponemataceae bacterium]
MDAEFTAIVRQLITEQGAESLLDTALLLFEADANRL